MKIRDIKEVLEFLNQDEMKVVKSVAIAIHGNCPNESGLKGENEACTCTDECFECWYKALNLEENQDKLDNVI
ncbi:hypothetical protein QJR26_03375 [Clostridium baratii]